jgi:hypothetical protein
MVVTSQNKIESITAQLEQLICHACVDVRRIDDFYAFSYPHLLTAETSRVSTGDWSVEQVTRRLTMVYGWMPCSPKSHSEIAILELAGLLNQNASLEAIMLVASRCLSNSLVAASKFAHWEWPDTAPMFDRTLEARYWPETLTRLNYQRTAVRRYLEWTAAIKAVSPELQAKAQLWAAAAFGYEVTAVRAIEAMAFYAAGDTSRSGSPPFAKAA